MFLCWAFSDNTDEYDLDKEVVEDAKARKRRIQSELTRALAVLGVKHSTFYSMLNKGKHSDAKKMLKKHLSERSDYLMELEGNPNAEINEEFNIHLEQADMTTIHEAYQFLVKKYIDGNENSTNEMFLDMEELKAKHLERQKAKKEKEEKAKNELKLNEKSGRRSR